VGHSVIAYCLRPVGLRCQRRRDCRARGRGVPPGYAQVPGKHRDRSYPVRARPVPARAVSGIDGEECSRSLRHQLTLAQHHVVSVRRDISTADDADIHSTRRQNLAALLRD